MWKRLSALLLVLLLFSSLAFSEEESPVYLLTETEFLQLQAIFGMLKAENNKLQTQLTELATESAKLKTELGEVNASLTKADESLKTYADDMNRTLSTERIKKVVYTILGVAAGGLVGYLIGAF